MTFLLASLLLLSPPLVAPEEFPEWFEDGEVKLFRADTDSADHPWIRAEYEVPVDAETIEKYLCDFERYDAMFKPGVKKVDVLANEGNCNARLHIVWKFPFPFKNRDGIVAYHVERPSDDEFVLRWVSGAKKGDPFEGRRIETIIGATKVKRLADGKSLLTYEYLGDLGGKFPDWLEEAAWKGEPPMYFSHLRMGMGLGDMQQPWPENAASKARTHFEETSQ